MIISPKKTIQIYHADVIDALKEIETGTVHCVVTSIPYWGLRDYEGHPDQLGQESTIGDFLRNITNVFAEVKRVLHHTGTLWLNVGDSYNSDRTRGTYGDQSKVGYLDHGRKRNTIKGLHKKNLLGQPWRVAFALQEAGWILRDDIIWAKCLAPSTRLYAKTQKGVRPSTLADLVRLDPTTVKLWNGKKWTQVVSWSPSETTDPLCITLRSGENISSTKDHRWPTQRGLIETQNLKVGDCLQRCVLPEQDTNFGTHIDVDLAWFAGLYLAEGSMSDDAIQIASHISETERFEKLEKLCQVYGGHLALHVSGDNGINAVIHSQILQGVIKHFITGKLSKGKHLHPRCWDHSNYILESLLDGYLSGDGSFEPGSRRWKLGFCRNYNLANDIRTLCSRLELTLTLKTSISKIGDKTYESFSGSIKGDPSGHHSEKDRNEIVKIEKTRGGTFYDLEVEDEPHLFALASGVLSHNSNPMPYSGTDRTTKSHETMFMFSKAGRYFYDWKALEELSVDGKSLRRCRSVWNIPTEHFTAHHATFPKALVQPCIVAGSSPQVCEKCLKPFQRKLERLETPSVNAEGIIETYRSVGFERTCKHDSAGVVRSVVMDPFLGSGTTGIVAAVNGRNFVGIEIVESYVDMALNRIQQEIPDLLFTDILVRGVENIESAVEEEPLAEVAESCL